MNFISNIKKQLEDKGYWEICSYIFFGGATTAVNIITFTIFYQLLNFSMITANNIAWVVAILFAFVTNKIWVFQSRTESIQQLFWEFVKFVFYRVLSLGIDTGSLVLIVDVFKLPVMVGKLVSQILVIAANYIFSKLFIFKAKK